MKKVFQILSMAAIVLAAVSCGGGGGGNAGQSDKPTKTPRNVSGSNFLRHECDAGTFYIEVVRHQHGPGHFGVIRHGTAVFDSKGKELHRFAEDERLLSWAGEAGIMVTGVSANSLFSFRTLESKPIGWHARFIKGQFIISRELRTDKIVHQFWDSDGELIWKGDAPRVLFDADTSKGSWVMLEYYDRPRLWLNLFSGHTSPDEGGDTPPLDEFVGD